MPHLKGIGQPRGDNTVSVVRDSEFKRKKTSVVREGEFEKDDSDSVVREDEFERKEKK